MVAPAGESLRTTLAALAADSPPEPASRLLALGWATVELDRAELELAADLGLDATAFRAAPDSGVLGARCRVALQAFPGGVALVILEPATEGRLSAALARHGEAPVAAWFVLATTSKSAAPHAGVAVTNRPTLAAGTRPTVPGTPSAAGGPFGPERIVSDGSIPGLRRLLVGAGAGTIRA